MKLDEVLQHRQSFTPLQSLFTGSLPVVSTRANRVALEDAYMTAMVDSLPTATLLDKVEQIFQQYALAASKSRQPRLAQTWRIIAHAVSRHLEKRLATAGSASTEKDVLEHIMEDVLDQLSSPRPSSMNTPASTRPVHAIAHALALTESTSNVTTPLARAVPHGQRQNGSHAKSDLLDVDTGEDLEPLPPSLTARHPLREADTDGTSEVRSMQADIRSHASAQSAVRPPLLKHDSDERSLS